MAAGIVQPPPLMPLEDAIDLTDFLEATGRTIPAHAWAAELIEARQRAQIEAMLS